MNRHLQIATAAAVLLAAGTSASLAYEFSTEIPYRVTGVKVLKLYEAPETTSKVVGRLKRGDAGLFIGFCYKKTDWCVLTRGGQANIGWARARHLSGYAD